MSRDDLVIIQEILNEIDESGAIIGLGIDLSPAYGALVRLSTEGDSDV